MASRRSRGQDAEQDADERDGHVLVGDADEVAEADDEDGAEAGARGLRGEQEVGQDGGEREDEPARDLVE